MSRTESWLSGEPKLQDVMLDPIVQQLMRSDGFSPETLWPFLKATSARLHSRTKSSASAQVRAEAARALAPLLAAARARRGPP